MIEKKSIIKNEEWKTSINLIDLNNGIVIILEIL